MAKAQTKTKEINPELEKYINKLLKEVMSSDTATITDKTKVIDRALKFEAIKQKVGESWGSELFGDAIDDDEEDDQPLI